MAHPHGGHRTRVRARLDTEGLKSFEPHEVIELLLFTVIPQRDVNPLAHELIARFGSVGGVLHASEEELTQVKCLGARSARYLRLLGEAARAYEGLTNEDRPLLNTAKRLGQYCEGIFDPGAGEQAWIFSLNKAGRLLSSVRVAQGDWTGRLTLRAAVEPVLRCQGQTAIFLQCRQPGDLQMRNADLDFTRRMAVQCARISVLLLDSVIMSGRMVLSLRQAGKYRMETAENVLSEPDEALNTYLHWLDGQ